jgi:hypothetical protein
MQLNVAIASLALLLAAALATGHAFGQAGASPYPTGSPEQAPKTAHAKVEQREALRRAAAVDQQKKKDYFTRRCSKPYKTQLEMEECREFYRSM